MAGGSREGKVRKGNDCGSTQRTATCSVSITSAILCTVKLRSDDMRRSTLALTAIFVLMNSGNLAALEISPDAYTRIQWPPPPGTYMPMPRQGQVPQRWNDCRGVPCYQEWRGWGGRQVEPRFEYPGAPGRRCRNVYGYLVPC